MAYEDYRKELIDGYYRHQLESLMSGYDPKRKTVILLPGGMGSQLHRSEFQYPASPNVINDVIWMDGGIVLNGDARKLEVTASGEDHNKHVIAAFGPFRFFNQTPYDELKERARDEDWNYAVFGFDWRRSLEESAGLFKAFILEFRDRVRHDYRVDPIPNLTIVCHSMGGMMCTHALKDRAFSGLGFQAILTIATPFYGTSTHQERYYNGISLLNKIYGAETVVRIVATLPGPYTLMFLPKEIYARDGAKLGLTRYPQIDPNGNIDADPYDPATLRRWPSPVKAHKQYFLRAKRELQTLAEPIDANISPVFFNVRSSLDTATAVELLWNDVDGDAFVPGQTPSPLAGIAGPGDGTVPAWSAWHAHTPPKNRHELRQARDHGNLLEHDEVLDVVSSIVTKGKLPKAAARSAGNLSVAGRTKVGKAVTEWAASAGLNAAPPADLFNTSVQRAVFSELIGGEKPNMVGPAQLLNVRVATPLRAGRAKPKRVVKRKKRV